MRSSAARVALGATAWIALGLAAFFVVRSDHVLSARRASTHAFDARAREVSSALIDLRTAQQAFVAPGQSYGIWASKADEFLAATASGLDALQDLALTADGHRLVGDARTGLAELRAINERAREALRTADPFSSADTVFTEGTETTKNIALRLESARLAEHVGADLENDAVRNRAWRDASVALGTIALAVVCLAALPFGRRSNPQAPMSHRGQLNAPPVPRESAPLLRAAVELCSDLNRAQALDDLAASLEHAATALDAAGLIVWVGRPGGPSLRPILAHGYSREAIARMPPVLRSADNAAAAAYRTGNLQIVLTRPGVTSGALAAPMVSPEGCIGAVTAEIKNGGEASDGVQAVISLYASQLAGLLAASVIAEEDRDEPSRALA